MISRCWIGSGLLAFACVPSIEPGPAPPEPPPATPGAPEPKPETPADQKPPDAGTDNARVLSLDPEELVKPLEAIVVASDIETLSLYAHPDRGMRFSPDAVIDPEDPVLSAKTLRASMTESEPQHFGRRGGEANAIVMSVKKYFEVFVAAGEVESSSVSKPNPQLLKLFPECQVIHVRGSKNSSDFVVQTDGHQLWIVAVLHAPSSGTTK
jgi:hypothetical protein